MDGVARADAHPVTTSTASRTAPAVRDTRVNARTVTGYRAPARSSAPVIGPGHRPQPSAPLQRRAEEADRRGAEVQHGLVKRRRVKPAPQSFLARSRSLRISSLPQVYRP